jgi:glycosyltransferase involved in cell wall biosynthesis
VPKSIFTFTCIIPFFNEKDGILNVLDEVVKIKDIDQLLLVDDGSTDESAEKVKKHYPQLKIIRNKNNLGKSEALAAGLEKANGQYVILLDADLKQLYASEVEKAIKAVRKDPVIDMIIFNRLNASFLVKTLRGATLISGQRIIKKEELLLALSFYKPKGYQVEVALNQYMMDKQKKVYWMPISVLNTPSTKKRGLIKGLKKIINMHIAMFLYIGFFNAFRQFFFFCKREYKVMQ